MSLPTPHAPSTASLIGVAVAVSGNILISLALNCQKLTHVRLQREWMEQESLENEEASDEDEDLHEDDDAAVRKPDERSALLKPDQRQSLSKGYGSNLDGSTLLNTPEEQQSPENSSLAKSSDGRMANAGHSIQTDSKPFDGGQDEESDSDDAEDDDERKKRWSKASSGSHAGGTRFLRSKLWWLGIFLMSLGEFGNFLSYGFAPASLVAPLGAVALLSNVIISPLLLHEKFKPADLGGIFLAIVGAVTVVFSSKQDDERLSPGSLWKAIKRTEFIVYASISAGVAVVLAIASTTRAGDKIVLIEVGICAVFGAFTVLSTKAISSLLSRGNPLDMFTYPITYPVIFVLIATAIAQITYLNRALQRFDSRQVIPTQFVLFTISAIVGSAVLYRDFENVEAHRMINFLFGCMTTFAGVFVLTRRNGGSEQDQAQEEEQASRRRARKRRKSAKAKHAHASSRTHLQTPLTDSWTSGTTSEDLYESTDGPETPGLDQPEPRPAFLVRTSQALSLAPASAVKPIMPSRDREGGSHQNIRFDESQLAPPSSSAGSARRGRWLSRPSLASVIPLVTGSDPNLVTRGSRHGSLPGPSVTLNIPASAAASPNLGLSSSVPSPLSPLSASLPQQHGARFASRPVSLVADRPFAAAPTGLFSAGQYLLLPATIASSPMAAAASRQARLRSLSQPSTPVKKRSKRALRDAAKAQAAEARGEASSSANREHRQSSRSRSRERDLEAALSIGSSDEEGALADVESPRQTDDWHSSLKKERPKSEIVDSIGRRSDAPR